jgi:hypothetical protein
MKKLISKKIDYMSKQPEKVKITASILPKSDEKMRLRAVREKLSLGELLEIYQETYDKMLEYEKEKRIFNRELDKIGKSKCPSCKAVIVRK